MSKKRIIGFLMILLIVINFNIRNTQQKIETNLPSYYENNEILEQKSGEYKSTDGKIIKVNDDKTIIYENSYALTTTENSNGNTISGKVGTNSKTANFYQLNDSVIISSARVNYTHNSKTNYLYEYTAFFLETIPEPNDSGKYKLYQNTQLINSYSSMQDAINASKDNDIIKITDDVKITEGVYINKNITIDGNNHVLDKSAWKNSLFIIEEGTTVNIKNLIIDGKSSFEIDYSLAEPTLKSESIQNTPVSTTPIIISKGNINIDVTTIKNNYFSNTSSTINIVRGNATITNSNIIHNYGINRAVAIQVGSTLRTGETTFPVQKVYIDKCNLEENYAKGGSGGAIIVNFTEYVKITNTSFLKNVASTTSSGGGAIYFEASSVSIAEKNNLEYTQAYFDNCKFNQNYCGNDGLAISSDSAELYITNSTFTNNKGTGGTGCVGTVSCMISGNRWYDVIIKDTTFKNNYSEGVSVFGDHGTLVNLKMDNVKMEENNGNMSVLLYSAKADIKNVTAINEKVQTTVFDIRPYRNISNYPLYTPQNIKFNNVNIEGTIGPTDILLRKYQRNQSYNSATATIENTVVANIDLWDNTYLNVNGTLKGNVSTDSLTPKENVTVINKGKIIGEYNNYPDTYVITLFYPTDNNEIASKFLYLKQNKEYSYQELYNYHKLSKEDYKLEFYTDNSYTVQWDRKITDHQNIYAKYIEHKHTYNDSYITINEAIYTQCECGHPKLEIGLKVSKNNKYTGKEIPVSIIGNIDKNKYELKYYIKDGSKWKLLLSVPKNAGTYKAKLTYNNISVETEYKIQKGFINPPTLTNNIILVIIVMLITIICTKFTIPKLKKY